MSQNLNVLELGPELQRRLENGGIELLSQLRDATFSQLQATGLSSSQARLTLGQLERYLRRRFAILFPMLPEACQYVECAFLNLPAEALVRLELHRFQYLYQLAMSRRLRLEASLGAAMLPSLEQALDAFVESYRQGEIVLHVEELIYDG